MKRNLITVIFIISTALVFLVLMNIKDNSTKKMQNSSNQNIQENQVKIRDKTITVELAITPEEQAQGLMYRKHLSENTGMLFVFQQETQRTFWMKNTEIPLDIIWIDSSNKIVQISANVPTCKSIDATQLNCPQYSSQKPVLYVLEVNAGWAIKNNINEGDEVELMF